MNIIWWGLGIIMLFLMYLIPFDSTSQRQKKGISL